jgi:hypothetical protein
MRPHPFRELFRALIRISSMEPLEADLERRIITVRGMRVMLDEDLAQLYGVSTKRLNEQVRRNAHRFPHGFMIALTADEMQEMRSHFTTASKRNFQRAPLAFTEHGSIMLASVLNTPVAVEASVRVVRAFVKMREILSMHSILQKKLDELERRVDSHDGNLRELFAAIRQLITPSEGARKKIGFKLRRGA